MFKLNISLDGGKIWSNYVEREKVLDGSKKV